jgi:hypothetical protein
MAKRPQDAEREERIQMEIIVDAYGPEEQALGWYTYLEETLTFPFVACCVSERSISPLQVGDEVDIIGMAPEAECQHEMFVLTRWGHGRSLAIPLSQLEGIAVDEPTEQALGDWQYWVRSGYQL